MTALRPAQILIDGGVDPVEQPDLDRRPAHVQARRLVLPDLRRRRHRDQALAGRAAQSQRPDGPYARTANPILTQRDLPATARFPDHQSAGHADLVKTPTAAGGRPSWPVATLRGDLYNTGRETFLLPVQWKDGWPMILAPGRGFPMSRLARLSWTRVAPSRLPRGNFTWRDEFDQHSLDRAWMFVRVPKHAWVDLAIPPRTTGDHAVGGRTRLIAQPRLPGAPPAAHQRSKPAPRCTCRWKSGTEAGIAAFQNETHWYFLGVRHDPGKAQELFLQRSSRFGKQIVATIALPDVSSAAAGSPAMAGDYSFGFDAGIGWQWLKQHEDGTVLSTDVAGGIHWRGAGTHARTIDDQEGENHAD